VPGLIDYVFAVPPKSSAKQRATSHMLANISALGLFTLARAGRRQEDERPAAWAVALEVAGMSLLTTGGWLGGTLVFRNQIGVDHRYANAGQYRIEAVSGGGDTIDAAAADELKVGQMKLLRAGDRRVVLARTDHGYAAFDDFCTHKGGPLSDGALVCDTVQCPWHGSQFDVMTGRVKEGPATDAIVTYAVEERDGRVLVTLDDRLKG
jgi:nitrite reductase/ring-hydroxylating ferredoxin subunit